MLQRKICIAVLVGVCLFSLRTWGFLATFVGATLAAQLVAQERPATKPVKVPVPGKAMELGVVLPRFQVDTLEMRGARQYMRATSKDGSTVFSVILEKVEKPEKVAGCHEHLPRRAKAMFGVEKKAEDVSQWGEISILQVLRTEQFDRMSVLGCLQKEDVFADLHISKMLFKPKDEDLFKTIFASVSLAVVTGRK